MMRRQMTVMMAERLFSERAADEGADEPSEGEGEEEEENRRDGDFDVGGAFRKEARCFGLLFKTCRMERVFLDGHARLHRNLVYLGYLVVLCADFFEFVFFYFFYLYLQAANEPGSKYESVDSVCDAVPPEASREELFLSANDLTLKFLLPFYSSCWIVGSALQFTIHKCDSVREKSWAIPVTWAIYLIMVLFSSLAITNEDKVCWPAELQPFIFIILPVFSFFSGAPSFTPSLVLFVLSLLLYGLEFPISKRWLTDQYRESSPGDANEEAREDKLIMMTQFVDSTYFIVVLVVIYAISLYPQEIESRKQFLQRMLMHSQQKQIIKEKTRNENLQKKLLESMLPTHIVKELQLQDFRVSSWDQLRGLSHRHFGVSILFAELEGFAAFSSEVAPAQVMAYLNDLFLVFDNLCERHEVYKVETVGDQYVAAVGVTTGEMHKRKVSAGGDVKLVDFDLAMGPDNMERLRESSASNTRATVEFGMAIVREATRVAAPRQARTCPSVRVGIHTGDCISGLVGTRNFRFCLFGDTMNTAARMEQTSVAECIHATKDVVALVPDYPWEAQKQMEVKGKGSMQTYLFKVQGLNSSEGSDADDDNTQGVDESASSLPAEYVNPLLVHEERLSFADSILLPSGGEAAVCRDALPVTLEMYIKHTKCFGLLFKKPGLEVDYLNGEAMRHKHVTYLGYGLFVLVLLSNLAFGYIFGTWQLIICSQPNTSAQFCIETFSEDAYEIIQQYPDWHEFVDYEFLITFAKFRMTPVCAIIISVLVFLGVLSHWWIHWSKRFKMKWWALACVFFFYYLLMIIMLLFALVFARLSHESAQWPHSVNFTVMILSTLLIFFTGCPFVLYLIFWITATGLYCGLGYHVVTSDLKWVINFGYTTPVITAQHFILRTAQPIFWQGVVLVIGSFLREITNRKRFLQRILMAEQHKEIINEKNKHASVNKTFSRAYCQEQLWDE
jgi:class 3 adenylate cyclase